MPVVKTVRRRRSTITIEAHGEVLFTGTGPVGRWTKKLVKSVETATAANSPRNKRPRWAHYGKPLKQTFGSSVRTVPSQLKVHGAVGSSSDYATFVDQGTGVFAGHEPWEAKILPPWRRGSPSLYEQGWSPNASGARNTVMIQGQPGQFFFDKGLKQGFAVMRLLSFEAPLTPSIESAIQDLPLSILSFLDSGNTVANPAFKAQLKEWRLWRQEAFNEGRRLGKIKGRINSRPGRKYKKRPKRRRAAGQRQRARDLARDRQQRFRDREREKNPRQSGRESVARRADRTAFFNAMVKKYGAGNVDKVSLDYRKGRWFVTIKAKNERGKTIYKEVSAPAKS